MLADEGERAMNAEEHIRPLCLGSPEEVSESECESYDQVAEAGNPCGHMPPESESESEHPYEKEDKGGSLVAVSVKEAEHVEAARSKLQISPPRTFKRSNAAI